MAVAFAATVILFLFSFSTAQYSPSYHPKKEFYRTDPTLPALPDSDPKPRAATILPSERPESEPATFVEIEPEVTQLAESKSREKEQDEEKSVLESESQADSLPLTTFITLRPVNRHFSRVPFFRIRRGQKCHGRHHHFHQLKQRFGSQREISFGIDMVLAKDQDRGYGPAHTGNGQGLEGWENLNHDGQRFSLSSDDAIRQEMYRLSYAQPHFYRHRRHHRGEDDEEEEEEKDRHEDENGIIKGIRRFLNF